MPTITLTITETAANVTIRAAGDLGGADNAARVACTICRFAESLWEGGKPVSLGDEIVKAAL